MKSSRTYYIFLAIGIVVFDVISKRWALQACREEWIITPVFSCETTLNTGISWSFFNNTHQLFLIMLILLVIGLLMYYTYEHRRQNRIIVGEIMAITGALCNVLDRFLYGGVIDFIVLHYKEYAWPVFNIADIIICCGIIVMLLSAWDKIC